MKNTLTDGLSPQDQDWLSQTIAKNRALFGGWFMEDDGSDDGDGDEPDDGQEGDGQEGQDDPADDGQDGEDGGGFDSAAALEKIRKLNSENRNLRKAKKEAEDKAASVGDATERIKALEAENLRIRVGARLGLPDALIDRLKGDTEEEILEDAEKLLGVVSGGKKKPPTQRPKERPRGGGDPDDEPEETDPRKLAALIPRQ